MNALVWILAIYIFILDQALKILVISYLELNQSIEIIKNIFHITLVHNRGAAFGIFTNQTLFFVIISILTVAAIIMLIRKKQNISLLRNAALGFILGGVWGNLVDRLRLGYVVDFLDFRIWPVFNVADSAVTIGVFLLIISLLYNKDRTL